ncbi:putative toxin [Campylobacter coli]
MKNSVKGEYNCKWCLIPRLIRNKGESSFDPVPILNSSFVISELSNIKQKTLTFQRTIANVEHPSHFALQSPKEFKSMLENEQSFASYGGKEKQIEDLLKTAQHKLETIKKANGISKKTKKALQEKQKKEVEKCKELKNSKKKISPKLIGDTGEYVASLLFGKRSTRYLSNQRKLDANFNIYSFNHTIPDFLVSINGIPSLVEVKNVQVQSLTEQISFELKLAREYELDYIFVCNHYTHLTENVAGSALTREEHEELARDDGDKVGEFNKETKRLKKAKVAEVLNEKDKDKRNWSEVSNVQTSRLRIFSEKGGDCDARSGFIYHRHLHRSIKTVFKEIYLHHIKGVAPNKIVIKRLNLNNAEDLEEVFNENQNLQKS